VTELPFDSSILEVIFSLAKPGKPPALAKPRLQSQAQQ
jgi:hypothetical protein